MKPANNGANRGVVSAPLPPFSVGTLLARKVATMKTTSAFLFLCLAVPAFADQAIYDRDPEHSWNRLYRLLYTRTMRDGVLYDQESLEPPFYRRSKFLIEGPS